ncbi:MAG TPA: acetamidase/formamidase family protein [Chloroflexia bacterium]|nr:acetamidase/formamidase family protein [Chloroflexia bacterium]
MTTYRIEPEHRTLHGKFSRELPPVLTIDSGDTVVFRTLDAGWGLEPATSIEGERRKFEPHNPEMAKGHALCGPVEIRGAERGMTLAIDIVDIRPGSYGATYAGGWSNDINDRLGISNQKGIMLAWTLDPDAMTATDQFGHTVDLHPFMGVMGLPPDEPGLHPTAPPRFCGGNIDCKELVAGTTLYLPITIPGALFSVGDGHGRQGDGESSTTAIECPMERVELTFHLHRDMRINTPHARTSEGWLTLAFHQDLNEAAALALEAMLDLMMEQYSVERLEALALASLVVDLRVTQMVNGVKGVHAVLPHGAVR